jgi:hypothetical protein
MGYLIMVARFGLFFLSQTSQLHKITNPLRLSSNDVSIFKGISILKDGLLFKYRHYHFDTKDKSKLFY